MTPEGPNRPEPQPLKLDGKTTAIVVLDLSRALRKSAGSLFEVDATPR